VTNDTQNIWAEPLGRLESEFLIQAGPLGIFTLKEATHILGRAQAKHARTFMDRLVRKGWIGRIKPGLFAVIPLSSGTLRTPQIHEFLVAMELVRPATIAFFSAMNYHGLTEQLPQLVYVATNHKVARLGRVSLGVQYRIICVRPARFFGMRKEWINEHPFLVTDQEKTIIDGLALPQYVGGVGTVARALATSWTSLDEKRLHGYAARFGTSAVAKRLGYLQETLELGKPDELRRSTGLSSGFPRLDPTLPAEGALNRRWGILVNAQVRP
jgi:predicted transcriptional regulator of viral defense system